MISKDNNDDIIRFRVVHCCVSYVEAELPVAVLTGILAEYFQHEKNIQKLFKENVNWPEDYKQKLLELINDG